MSSKWREGASWEISTHFLMYFLLLVPWFDNTGYWLLDSKTNQNFLNPHCQYLSTLPAWAHWNLQLERENMEESAMNKFSPDNISAIIHQKFPIWWTEERRGEIRARREKFTFLPYHSCPIFSPCSAKKEEEGSPVFHPGSPPSTLLSPFLHSFTPAGRQALMSGLKWATLLRVLFWDIC